MSKKSEARKAAYQAARKKGVLPILLAMTVILEEAWTLEGQKARGYRYEALGMSKENKKKVCEKWRQIVRWRDAYCEKHKDELGALREKGKAVFRDLEEKHGMIERAIVRHAGEGLTYGHALSVETIVVSALIDDWVEERGWRVGGDFRYFRWCLATLSQWVCPPADAISLLASMVYYDVRDKILERPDWSRMWQGEGPTETTQWILDHPEAEFSRSAEKWSRDVFGRGIAA